MNDDLALERIQAPYRVIDAFAAIIYGATPCVSPLFLEGSMPLRYIRFLGYCADRILLRKANGGSTFIHRTFLEHIAALTLARIAELVQRVATATAR